MLLLEMHVSENGFRPLSEGTLVAAAERVSLLLVQFRLSSSSEIYFCIERQRTDFLF